MGVPFLALTGGHIFRIQPRNNRGEPTASHFYSEEVDVATKNLLSGASVEMMEIQSPWKAVKISLVSE